MEKLQAALDKARKERKKSNPATPAEAAPVGGDSSLETLWANIPKFETNEQHLDQYHVVTKTARISATPFDILRTKVLLLMRQHGWKRLAITSPMPNSGKTTIACNLALSLSRQHDLRTLLVDLDLRDPSISEFFQVTPPHSVGEVLTGRVDFADQAMRYSNNLACSMAIGPEPDPSQLLLASETGDVLESIEQRYQPDITIFDMPSVLVNDDTRAFLKNVDCALIVIRADVTRYSHFDTCEREIGQYTNVLGITLNAYQSGAQYN